MIRPELVIEKGEVVAVRLAGERFPCSQADPREAWIPKNMLVGFKLSEIPEEITIKPVESLDWTKIGTKNDINLSSFADGSASVFVEEMLRRKDCERYVEGEAVRFWVGVKPKNSPTIPRELWKPCSLSVTRPDGTRRVDSVGWPVDGMVDHGWSGGWGFGDEKVEPGVYVLTLECASEKTDPLELVVEQSEIVAQVKARFRFERDGAITKSTHVPIVLTVDNGSQTTIRFPQRGAMMEGISLEIVRREPASHWALFFPWKNWAIQMSCLIPTAGIFLKFRL